MKKTIWLVVILAVIAIAQETVDYSGAASAIPWPVKNALPGRCTAGAMFTLSTGTAGANIYQCGTTNNWVLFPAGLPHYTLGGSAPAVVPGTAAGTGGTCTMQAGSTDEAMQVNCNVGTTPSGSTLATVTFATPFSTGAIALCGTGNVSSASIPVGVGAISASAFTITNTTAQFVGSTGYAYVCMVRGY